MWTEHEVKEEIHLPYLVGVGFPTPGFQSRSCLVIGCWVVKSDTVGRPNTLGELTGGYVLLGFHGPQREGRLKMGYKTTTFRIWFLSRTLHRPRFVYLIVGTRGVVSGIPLSSQDPYWTLLMSPKPSPLSVYHLLSECVKFETEVKNDSGELEKGRDSPLSPPPLHLRLSSRDHSS